MVVVVVVVVIVVVVVVVADGDLTVLRCHILADAQGPYRYKRPVDPGTVTQGSHQPISFTRPCTH